MLHITFPREFLLYKGLHILKNFRGFMVRFPSPFHPTSQIKPQCGEIFLTKASLWAKRMMGLQPQLMSCWYAAVRHTNVLASAVKMTL